MVFLWLVLNDSSQASSRCKTLLFKYYTGGECVSGLPEKVRWMSQLAVHPFLKPFSYGQHRRVILRTYTQFTQSVATTFYQQFCMCCLLGFLRCHRWNDKLCIKYVWVEENDNCVPSGLAQYVMREQRIKVLHHGESLDITTTQHPSTGRCSPKESRILSKELGPISVRAKIGFTPHFSPPIKRNKLLLRSS